jgi:hypothetical protein
VAHETSPGRAAVEGVLLAVIHQKATGEGNEENEVEPIRVVMSVGSLVRALLWTGLVVALAVLVIIGTRRADGDPSTVSDTSTSTTCTV